MNEQVAKSLVMNFPIEKGIKTELFIDRTTAHCIGETWIRVVSKKGNNRIGTCQLEDKLYLALKCYLDLKRCGNERSGLEMSFNRKGIECRVQCRCKFFLCFLHG